MAADIAAIERDAKEASGSSKAPQHTAQTELRKKKKKYTGEMSFDIDDYDLDSTQLGFNVPYMFDATRGDSRRI
jgi:hypothetical protein